jgi:hypothetical protein
VVVSGFTATLPCTYSDKKLEHTPHCTPDFVLKCAACIPLGAGVPGDAAAGHGCEDAFTTLSTDDIDVLIIYADTYENPL